MMEDVGWIDTCVFVHARTRDSHSEACRALLTKLEAGDAQGQIDPVVVHELTYVLTTRFPETKLQAAAYIKMILSWDNIDAVGGKEPLIAALITWAEQGVDFADALLAARAQQDGTMVSTVNVRDIVRAGAFANLPE